MKRLTIRLKTLAGTVRTYIQLHKLISAAAFLVLIILILVIVFSCSRSASRGHVEEPAAQFEETGWKRSENGFLYYDEEGYINEYGIDISEWVEEVDFRKIKSSGIDFVILRVGYRGYETGKFVLDNNLSTYLKQAKAAGLRLGAYFVSQAINEEEAIEEAEYVMEHIDGYPMEMPLYIDLETVYDAARTDHLTQEDYTKIARAFCEAVEEQGYRGGVYANNQWFHDNLDFSSIRQYDIWLAQYSDRLSTDLPINMWQFTNEGLVDGCEMWVDLNVRVSEDTSGTEK